jgi:hypothetical protein
MELNELWHSRLPVITNPYSGHTACFVAEFGNVFYASAIWTSPIARAYNGKNYIELRRFAISPDAPKNTASRMLKVMRIKVKAKYPEIVKLISYQDTDVHKGTIYKSSGWQIAGSTKGGSDSWLRPNMGRFRVRSQAPGDKIRWEYDL